MGDDGVIGYMVTNSLMRKATDATASFASVISQLPLMLTLIYLAVRFVKEVWQNYRRRIFIYYSIQNVFLL
jgi:hypothetical protein